MSKKDSSPFLLQAEGYDVDALIEQVGELVKRSPEEIMERDKERGKVEARSMLCYWATDSLGISRGELAKRIELTQPAGSQAVRRGKPGKVVLIFLVSRVHLSTK